MEKTFLQVRTETKDKEQASVILEELGTIYTTEEQIAEVSASMAMEQMPLDKNDINLLKEYQESGDKDNIRKQLLENYKEN